MTDFIYLIIAAIAVIGYIVYWANVDARHGGNR
jgi:hypothetical protein